MPVPLRTTVKLMALGGAVAGVAAAVAVASNPVVRDEARLIRRLSRPLGPRGDPLAPVPPPLPPGSVVALPDRGEVFARDSGAEPVAGAPPVLLLHGWTASADLNWFAVYDDLAARHRVIALDHRGHGRGMRSSAPFSLEACADDAAALLHRLGVGPAVVVGYSMGGAIAMLLWSRHPEAVSGLVFSGTALEWSAPRERALWRTMSLFEVALRHGTGDGLVERAMREAIREDPDVAVHRAWVTSEFQRGSPTDLAGAGRALAGYDGRALATAVDVPAAVVLTTRDHLVPPAKQRRLADALGAPVFEVDADHLAPFSRGREFSAAICAAVTRVAAAPEPGRPTA